MKRPEKKKEEGNPLGKFGVLHYNQAYDDWEKFYNWRMAQLPNEYEINEIIYCHSVDMGDSLSLSDKELSELIKAILNRIGR